MARAFLLWLLFLPAARGFAQQDSLSFNLFSDMATLRLDLTFDYKEFTKTKFSDTYQPATLTVYLDSARQISRPVRIKARGEFRRSYCAFPPIRLNLKDADFGIPSLDAQEKLKLVTNCRYQTAFQNYLLQEYLVYRVYNVLTPRSFRVRLLDINYIDSEGKREPMRRYGFIIEDDDEMAARNDCSVLDLDKSRLSVGERESTATMALFQYMIGNTDWAAGNLHNFRLIRSNDPVLGTMYFVPYDFDYCGLVNAHYAIPAEVLNIPNVRQRLYMGPCRGDAEWDSVFAYFLAKKEEIYDIYRSFAPLDESLRRESIQYLDGFFEQLEHPDRIRPQLRATCN
ncbi:MAG: hypothetical protein OHK0039_26140 [Bacteroidia bacterium]